jgi:hypothetical protein
MANLNGRVAMGSGFLPLYPGHHACDKKMSDRLLTHEERLRIIIAPFPIVRVQLPHSAASRGPAYLRSPSEATDYLTELKQTVKES